ncbi:MAG TPA: alpha/beta hydrolase-fold protein [Polyangiaceae bacterium]
MHRRVLLAGQRAVGGGVGRRAFLAGTLAASAGLAASSARASGDDPWRPRSLDVRALRVEGAQSRLFVLATPNHVERWERVPLVVLLHGLSECGDEHAGAWAWLERYGLGTSYDRLVDAGSMRGLAFTCPYMPDLPIAQPAAFDDYARWLVETVVPRARREAPIAFDVPARTHLGGCSLGGHFSLEVLLRRPEAFGAWAGVQTAVSAAAGERYAGRLAQAGARPVLVETSTEDPFRAGNEAIDRALSRAGVGHAFVELPGPHDQPWLRRSGTARMLQWLDDLPRPELRPPAPDRPVSPG